MKACSSCGEKYLDHYRFCIRCGSKLEGGKKPREAPKRAVERKFQVRPSLVWGSVILSVGLLMLGYSFVTVSNLVERSLSPEIITTSFLWVIIMLVISLFLITRGVRLIRE